MSKLKIVCAWCGKTMGEKDGEGKSGETSTICPACKRKHFPPEKFPHLYEEEKKQ